MSLALAALFALGAPGPVCGDTAAMDALRARLADPAGPLMIAAHRGGHLRAPENSLAAIDEAVAAGADFVELDVKVSSDGVPFLLHDQRVDRTTDGSGDAETLSYAAIARLRLKGGDTPPPTLVAALRHACGRVLVDLDLKTDRIGPIVAAIQALGMVDQVVLFDSDSAVLRAARAIEPRLRVMTRVETADDLATANHGLAPVTIVHGTADRLTPALTAATRALPARLWVNSLGTLDAALLTDRPRFCGALAELRRLGAGVVQTDQPAAFRIAIAECAARQP